MTPYFWDDWAGEALATNYRLTPYYRKNSGREIDLTNFLQRWLATPRPGVSRSTLCGNAFERAGGPASLEPSRHHIRLRNGVFVRWGSRLMPSLQGHSIARMFASDFVSDVTAGDERSMELEEE